MREKSPDEYIDALEHRWRRREKMKKLLCEIALSIVMIADKSAVTSVYRDIYKTDTLPPD